jgi:hypothetical protein
LFGLGLGFTRTIRIDEYFLLFYCLIQIFS